MRKLRVFFALLLGLSRLLSVFLPETPPRPSLISSKDMRRITTADKVSVGFHYLDDVNKELGNVRYNLVDGYFVVLCWPSSFSALRKITEYMKLLAFAKSIVKSELVK